MCQLPVIPGSYFRLCSTLFGVSEVSEVIKPYVSTQAGQLLLKVNAVSIQSSQNLCSAQMFG